MIPWSIGQTVKVKLYKVKLSSHAAPCKTTWTVYPSGLLLQRRHSTQPNLSTCVWGPHPATSSVLLNGSPVPKLRLTKHLGVVLSDDLRWKHHIDSMLKSVLPHIALYQQLSYKHHLPSSVLRKLYISLFDRGSNTAQQCGVEPRHHY